MATLSRQRVTERCDISHARVDRKEGVIKGARLLGRKSKNGRSYTDRAMESAAKLYKGMDLRVDHAEKPGSKRGVLETIGYVIDDANLRVDLTEGAVYGDLQIFTESAAGRQLLEMAERNPGKLGLSHDAMADMDGTVVEDVQAVNSLDFVRNPATNSNLFESEDDMTKIAITEYVEALDAKSPTRAAITEHVKACEGLEVAKDATAESVLVAVLERVAKGQQKPADKPTSKDGDDDPIVRLTEQVTMLTKRDTARGLLGEHKIAVTEERVTELASLADRDHMVARIKQWPDSVKQPTERPIIESLHSAPARESEANDFSYESAAKRWGLPEPAEA